MLIKAIILGLIGVFCILDSRLLGRLNFERPLITCTLVGIALGDLQTGLTVGASMELISMGLVNIGGAVPPDMNMAAIITSAFAIMTSASMETALAIAMPIAVLGQFIGVVGRTALGSLTHVADNAIEQGSFKRATNIHIIWGTIIYALLYFVPIFLAIYAGTDVVEAIVNIIPAWITQGLNLATKFLTAYGLALLMSIMLNKELTVYFLLGFFMTAYFGLDITGIAIFACLLAFILSSIKYKKGGNNGGGSSDALDDEYDPLEDDDDILEA